MSGKNLFEELKRRNVYKVAMAYVVVSWLLIQLPRPLPTFTTPSPRKFSCLALVGFPIALGFSGRSKLPPKESRKSRRLCLNNHIASTLA